MIPMNTKKSLMFLINGRNIIQAPDQIVHQKAFAGLQISMRIVIPHLQLGRWKWRLLAL